MFVFLCVNLVVFHFISSVGLWSLLTFYFSNLVYDTTVKTRGENAHAVSILAFGM